MTYFFSGVFILGDDGKVANELSNLFGGRIGLTTQPTPCSVVAFAADYEWPDAPAAFDEALVRASRGYPGQTFVRLRSFCWGGAIDHEDGDAFRDGQVLRRESSDEDSIIVSLFAHAGVALKDGFLEPLTRDWFKGKGDFQAATDKTYMRMALEVARAQMGKTGVNPAVGCTLRFDQRMHGSAWAATADGGTPHAEEQVLAESRNIARGATAYVTLEPCARRSAGGTSCTDLLIQAGVARVVIAASDPHPFAAGVGVERLRAAGIAVETGLFADEARAQNADFFAQWDRD